MSKRKHEAWMALTCDERSRQIKEREARANAFGLAVDKMNRSMIEDMIRDANRSLFGSSHKETFRGFCRSCHERDCPNAPIKPVDGFGFIGDEFRIPIKKAGSRKARRN
jgi:hypothetical protein